jgi:transcriptional regulator with XRE-family HTH domain
VTEWSRGERLGQQDPDEEISSEEQEFLWRWLPLLFDRLGGGGDGAQKRIAERMDWPSSTVSRYCTGKSLPDPNRLRELCNYLRVPSGQQAQLTDLLQRANRARQTRLKAVARQDQSGSPAPFAEAAEDVITPGVTPSSMSPTETSRESAATPGNGRSRPARGGRRRVTWIAVAAAVAIAAAAAFTWYPRGNAAQAGVLGSYQGAGLAVVSLPVTSLTPSLAATLDQDRLVGAASVTGFEFRSAQDHRLCLTAADTGPLAGKVRDQVEVAACARTANQIWIPEQWETNGSAYTHLVSDKYQSMCLNADNLGGLVDGHRVRWRAGRGWSVRGRSAWWCAGRSARRLPEHRGGGTQPSSAAVMNACRRVCGLTCLAIPARRVTRRTIRAAPWRSSRLPSAARSRGPLARSPMAGSMARAVRGVSGMVTTLPPLRVMTGVR